MSSATASHGGHPPQKPQNPQKPPTTTADLRERPNSTPAAKIPETPAQIPGPDPRHLAPDLAAYFCGDSRDFCGNHSHTLNAAGQTSHPRVFADSAVSAATTYPRTGAQRRRTP